METYMLLRYHPFVGEDFLCKLVSVSPWFFSCIADDEITDGVRAAYLDVVSQMGDDFQFREAHIKQCPHLQLRRKRSAGGV